MMSTVGQNVAVGAGQLLAIKSTAKYFSVYHINVFNKS